MPARECAPSPASGLAHRHFRNTPLGLHAAPFQRVLFDRIAVGHVVDLGLLELSFHRQQACAPFQPGAVPVGKAGERGQRAGDDLVGRGIERQRFEPGVDGLDVFQAQGSPDMPQEADLLAVAVDEDEFSVRFGDCEHHAGQAGAGAGIEDSAAFEERAKDY